MTRPVARLVAALVPAVLLIPATAHAEQVTVDDGAGDAKALNFAAEFGDEAAPRFLDAPAEVSVDITRTVIAHGKRVTVSTSFRDLVDLAEHTLEMRIFTPDERFSLFVSSNGDGSAGTQLYPERNLATEGAIAIRPCRSVRARYDVAADLVTVSFPATCVGAPRWVQVAVLASRLDVTPLGDGSVNLAGYGDDAFGGGLSATSRGASRSPKVRRG